MRAAVMAAHVSRVCRSWRGAALSDCVWAPLFKRRWGSVWCGSSDAPVDVPPDAAVTAYRERHAEEAIGLCTVCRKSTVVPVLYGFPSPDLIALRASKEVFLGGDQMLEGAGFPHWQCRACFAASVQYPWDGEALQPVPEAVRDQLQL